MFPILFQIGPFTFHTYGLLVAFGVFTGLKITELLAAHDGFGTPVAREAINRLLLYVVIGGLLGARVFYIAVHWRQFMDDGLAIFRIWEGGLVSFGGLIGGAISFAAWYRRNKIAPWPRILDWLAPCIAFGHALGRLGCLFAGCCYGKPTELPWGIIFTDAGSLAPLGIALHPTQIYEFIFLAFLGSFLLKRVLKTDRIAGVAFSYYLLIYSAGRFLIEFFRGDDPRALGLSPGQYFSLIVFIISFVLKYQLVNEKKKLS